MRKSGLQSGIFYNNRTVPNQCSFRFNDAKSAHFSGAIEERAGYLKKPCAVVSLLCKEKQLRPLTAHEDPYHLACKKIQTIRSGINEITESTLVKVHGDILMSMDKQVVAILVVLDLRVDFDTIDHKNLLEIFETDFGVAINAKKWISSILSCRTQRVVMNQNSSKEGLYLSCMHPRSSTLLRTTCLVAMRMEIIASCTLYLSFKSLSTSSQHDALRAIEAYIADVRAWMVTNRLKINDKKRSFSLWVPVNC